MFLFSWMFFYSLIGFTFLWEDLNKKNKDQFCSRAVKKAVSSLHMCGFEGQGELVSD